MDFFNKNDQNIDSRKITDTLEMEKRVRLNNIGLAAVGDIEYKSEFIYIVGIKNRRIYKAGVNSLSIVDTIGHGQGQGPGEVMRIEDVEVNSKTIFAPDPRQRKIMIFSLDGDLKYEITTKSFPPKQVEHIKDNRILVNADERPGMYKFYVINRKGDIISKFNKIGPSENPLKYNGHIDMGNDVFYFVGFSEPIIKAIGINGKVRFSRSTINNIPTSQNYNKSELGPNQVRYSYSNAALYSSYDLDYYNGKVYVLPIHNYNGLTNKYIDVYDSKSGYYSHSLSINGNPENISLGDHDVYVHERRKGNRYLTRYKIQNDEG